MYYNKWLRGLGAGWAEERWVILILKEGDLPTKLRIEDLLKDYGLMEERNILKNSSQIGILKGKW